MKPIEHLDKALELLEKRDMKYNDIWDSIIACRDHLQNASSNPEPNNTNEEEI